MASASSSQSRGWQALADLLAKPSNFFTVPKLTFGMLYCFFIIGHDRRKILRCNVTRNPHALWIAQQLREAWPYTPAHRFLLFDRDAKFGDDVVTSAQEMGSEPVRTAFRSPWQNGVAERWVGSCRRDLVSNVSTARSKGDVLGAVIRSFRIDVTLLARRSRKLQPERFQRR